MRKKTKYKDITGKKFGKWTAVSYSHSELYSKNGNKSMAALWNCICVCGTQAIISGITLRMGLSLQCSKCKGEDVGIRFTKHGFRVGTEKQKSFYSIWNGMVMRCVNPNNQAYANYGGRGIQIDPLWRKFVNFKNDMWESYEVGLTIDRIDSDGNYTKNNCRWATMKTQQNNRRTSYKSENLAEHLMWIARISATIHRVINKDLMTSKAFEKYVGCTPNEFRNHFEGQFEPWMNWSNNGVYRINGIRTWQYDHIIPINQFDLSKEKDRKRCFNYKNLRPLDAIKNYTEKIRDIDNLRKEYAI